MLYTPFRRQFVICHTPLTPGPDWKHHTLADGWVLSYQQDLRIRPHREPDGREVLILGNAFCLDTLEAGGSGRYVVLDWPYMQTDRAGATLSVFYGASDIPGSEPFVASSNAALAAAALRGMAAGSFPEPDHLHELRHRSLLNYVPAPGSRYREVRRLLRDQRLDLTQSRVERQPAPILPLASGRHQEAVDVVASELVRFALELRARTPGRVFLQLTAGQDSRTLAAAFIAAGIVFETVTLRTLAKPEEDVTIARAISARLGLTHSVVEMESTLDPARRELYWQQTSGGLNDWDLTHLFPGNVYCFLAKDDVMVGGACFELGRQKFNESYGDLILETATGAALWERLGREPAPAELAGFFDEWLAWRRQDPYAVDFVSTYYLDQRLGAWAATAMAGYDLMAGETIHPGNSRKIFAALITPSLEDQKAGRLQEDVIRTLVPELMDFPFNPVPLNRRLRQVVTAPRRFARRMLGRTR